MLKNAKNKKQKKNKTKGYRKEDNTEINEKKGKRENPQ